MATKIKGKYARQFGAGRVGYFNPYSNHETCLAIAPVTFYDDFLGQAFDVTHNWTAKDTSAAGVAAPALVADSPSGYVALSHDATNEKQESGIYPNDFRNWILNQSPIFEARVKISVLPTDVAEMYIGLAGDYVEGIIATDGPAEHIFFVLDGSGAVVIYTDDTANDNDGVATGVTVTAADWTVFRIDCSDTADVMFYINGERVASTTTFDMSTVPALTMQPYFMCHKETGVGVGTMQIDAVRLWQNRE